VLLFVGQGQTTGWNDDNRQDLSEKREVSVSEENELLRYLWIVRRWLWLILLTTLLAAGAVLAVNLHTAPVYSAAATLLIKPAPSVTNIDYTSALPSERLVRTYIQMIPSPSVLEKVIEQLGLQESPGNLAKRVKVQAVGDTLVVRLSVEDTDPARAALLANTIAEVFIAQNRALQEERYTASLSSMRDQLDETAALISATQAQIEAMGTPETPEERTELARLETVLASYRNTYASLLQGYEQMRLAAGMASDNVLVFQPAEVPGAPVRPKTLNNTALAGAIGLVVGLMASFLIEYLDDTIKSPDDAQRDLGLGTLAMIGRFNRAEGELVTLADPLSPAAEAFRLLRTNLWFSSVDQPVRKVLITSPGPLEGKSVVAANLGVVMAQAGLRVAVVDADLRRPRQHHIFGIHSRGGLSRSIMEGTTNGRVHPGPLEGLALLPAGELPPNPVEILASRRMSALLEELAGQVDVVLIDSPPILPIADAAVLAQKVDGVVLVLEAGKTSRTAARQAVERLEQVGGRLLGVVLNGIPSRGRGYYYYYYYNRYYNQYYSPRKRGRNRKKRSHADILPSQGSGEGVEDSDQEK
jgi:non-specific protein-tyrosine kinase